MLVGCRSVVGFGWLLIVVGCCWSVLMVGSWFRLVLVLVGVAGVAAGSLLLLGG